VVGYPVKNFISNLKLKNFNNPYAPGVILALLLTWKLISLSYNPVILPSPENTAVTIRSMVGTADFWEKILRTFARVSFGYLLSLVLGSGIGMAMGLNNKLNSSLSPVVSVLQTTPNVSWILLAIIWFGLNWRIVVFTIFISTIPIFIINARQGVSNTDEGFLEMGSVYELGPLTKFRKIYLPSTKPYILSAGEITVERAWKIGAMAELLSLNTGIGAGLYWARNNLETDRIFAWTVVLIFLGYLSSKILKQVVASFSARF